MPRKNTQRSSIRTGVAIGVVGAVGGAAGAGIALTAPQLIDNSPDKRAELSASNGNGKSTLQRASHAFNQAAERAIPAVVSVRATKEGPLGIGSGVIIRSDGYILTNFHVVEAARAVHVVLEIAANERSGDGTPSAVRPTKKYAATVVGSDPQTDLAILKLKSPPKDLPVIQFGDSDSVEVGDWVLAVGSPFGLSHSVTSGIVSAKGRGQMGVYDVEDFIQTDAAINPGNSGGPLLNLEGEMVGLNAIIFSETGGFIGIGFSIAANLVRQVADDIVSHGRVQRGWIGASAQDLNEEFRQYLGIKDSKNLQGAVISGVSEGGPAAQAGLKPEDVILSANGRPVTSSRDLQESIMESGDGDSLRLEILRNGIEQSVFLTIDQQPSPPIVPPSQQAGMLAPEGETTETLGFVLRDIPPEFAGILGVDPGLGALVIEVLPGSQAFEGGLAPGDVVLSANRQAVRSADQVSQIADGLQTDQVLMLHIQRGPDRKLFVPFRVMS